MVFEAENVSFAYGDTKIIKNFSTRIVRGDRLGIIGPNGCGKTTLLKLLLGEINPNSGSVRSGARIESAYFDQMRNILDEEKTIKENVIIGKLLPSGTGMKCYSDVELRSNQAKPNAFNEISFDFFG